MFLSMTKIYIVSAPTGYVKFIVADVYQSLPWIFDVLNEPIVGFLTLIVVSPLQSLIVNSSPENVNDFMYLNKFPQIFLIY